MSQEKRTKVLYEDIWKLYDYPRNYICIPTNGSVKHNMECVMGRGVALQAKKRFPNLPLTLGRLIYLHGNRVFSLGKGIYSFPVKPDWKQKAQIPIIRRSCLELAELIGTQRTYLPKPGCGNGQLNWEDVEEAIIDLLPENVIIVDHPNNKS